MTNKEQATKCLTLEMLREERASVAGNVAQYRLYKGSFAKTQYYVELTLAGERAAAYLGEDAARAMAAYEAIFHGTVTPCTLQAITEDFFA